MAVIAVLVAVAIPTFTDQLEKSRQSVDASNLRGAYAAARLAEIDQAVGDKTFKELAGNAAVGDTVDTSKLIYWYSPESGSLTLATNGATAASAVDGKIAEYGKASKKTAVADMSQFSMQAIKTSYTSSLNEDDPGTRDKAILVQFGTTSQTGVFGIASIKFVKTAIGTSGATAIVTAGSASSTGTLTVTSLTLVTTAPTDLTATPDKNAFTATAGKAKTYTLNELFGGKDGQNAELTFTVESSPSASYTKDGVQVTAGDVSVTAGNFVVADTATKGTYVATFVVKGSGKNSSNNDENYYATAQVTVTVTDRPTLTMPDTIDSISLAQIAGTELKTGATLPTVTVTYKETSSSSDQTATSGFKFGYSKLPTGVTTVGTTIADTTTQVVIFDDDTIPSTMVGMYLYVVSEGSTQKMDVVKDNAGTPAPIQITAP